MMQHPPSMIEPPAPWVPIWTCLKIKDGDTIKARVDPGWDVERKLIVRLLGLDTPEMKNADAKKPDPAMRARAKAAKARMQELLPPGTVFTATTTKVPADQYDRYDRYLAVVTLPDGRCLNDLLLAEGLAVTYAKDARGVLVRGN